ncbi:unnamed protein product [Pneumocystis jirovecii]|uniref:Uncharacterized protein n=2 Tax=Pneumocystis jirovecii TaxID=42068 RepID=L0PF54_PNEJI|nr:uncharacterized protein T551_00014 [Pneumocystis jirovecii RU7]KTW32529.1 hypothetical protein T551_00014 [Pneumocystis jirovecii RU7]CCJ30270.1 unnamed protein product [Pneumocystis jirovecii]
MSQLDSEASSVPADDSSVPDSSLVAQNIPRRRTHRRSSAVSLDWSSIGLASDLNGAPQTDPLVNTGDVCSVSDSLGKQGLGNDKEKDNESHSAVFLNSKNSTKKHPKFHSRFLVESISSLAHLYFGGLCKKKASKSTVPVAPTTKEYAPLQASCSMAWEPLIDLDAAILTEKSDSTVFGTPRWHRRARSVSSVFSSYTRASGNSLHSSCYRHGYPLKRKMSVIIEDTDMTLTQIPSSSRSVSSGILESKRTILRSIGDSTTTDNDLSVSQKANITSDNSVPDLVQGDLPQGDMSDAFLFIGDSNTLKPPDNITGNDEQSFVKNTKMKSRWRQLLKRLLTRKNS